MKRVSTCTSMKISNAASKPTTHARGCGVYIFNGDKSQMLLTQRGPKARHQQYKWEGPGGALEPGETFEQAAHREIMEELGIHIELGPVIGEYTAIIDSNGDTWECKLFSATTSEVPAIKEPTKCVGFGWFNREEVAHLSLADYVVKDMQQIGWM
jgi:8-oxo-dGTP pyrophosphatase MutT (NUDIX family)